MPVDGDKPPEIYEMNDFPHGYCVIISMTNICKQEKRECTKNDEDNLSVTFRYLGYDVILCRDCSAAEIIESIPSAVPETHDSIVVCILSHGKEGEIVASDGKTVYLKDVTSELIKCKNLRGKPKILFIQACQGEKVDTGLYEDEAVMHIVN